MTLNPESVSSDSHPPRSLAIAIRRAARAVDRARSVGGGIASHVSETAHATHAGAQATTTALQTLPDSTLKGFAATSVGLGAGVYLAGGPRLAAAAAVAPAVIMGVAMALRPASPAGQLHTSP